MTRPVLHPPLPPEDVDRVLQRIREHGGRVTPAKRALAQLLYATERGLTAEEIYDRLGIAERSVVYRNLAQFEELGIVEHLHLDHGQALYRRAGQATIPVVCGTCGRTVDLDRSQAKAFVQRVAERTGITIDLTHFPLTGICQECAPPPAG